MRIAIIGTGISGLGAALALNQDPRNHVVLYEKELRPGGHSATVDIDYDGARMAVDTGFIVYNNQNYPRFSAMLDWLRVASEPADMSFSVSADRGRLEWCGRDECGRKLGFLHVANGLFAQRRNLLSPGYIKMLLEILRFQDRARADARANAVGAGTLSDYLQTHGFSDRLRDDYLVPMGAAIWSTSPARMLDFPAESFISFFDNHCLLQWRRPRWRTVAGGSRSYVRKAAALFGDRLRLGTAVEEVRRGPRDVEVLDARGGRDSFDHVVIAAHAPDALAMLADPDPRERSLLSACSYSANEVVLHRDARLMPRRKAAWAAWNFLREGEDAERKVAVTYWMNALQALDRRRPVFVTLNPPFQPAPELTFARFSYDHPQFDVDALAAARRLGEIQGQRRTWFCGAWAGHGFHEDGLVSGLSVAAALGSAAPWETVTDACLEAAE